MTLRNLLPALPLLVLAPTAVPGPDVAGAGLIGPPAICHPFEIGGAQSLPWGGKDPFDRAPDYHWSRVVNDTAIILQESDDALVHMETLRRAVIYLTGIGTGKKVERERSRMEAYRLVARLQARILDAHVQMGRADLNAEQEGMLWLDLGFVLGAFGQAGWQLDVDGVAALRHACRLRFEDGALYLGAALATWMNSKDTERCRLLHRAAALAEKPGSLLRRNLLSAARPLFGVKSYDALVSELRRKIGKA